MWSNGQNTDKSYIFNSQQIVIYTIRNEWSYLQKQLKKKSKKDGFQDFKAVVVFLFFFFTIENRI